MILKRSRFCDCFRILKNIDNTPLKVSFNNYVTGEYMLFN